MEENSFKVGFSRNTYFHQIEPYMEKPIIKVIVGMRRAGKSYILRQFIDKVNKEKGVPKENIVYIDKELLDFDFIKNYTDLHNYVKSFFKNKRGRFFIFVDEVQEIEAWEKAVVSFNNEGFDVYISGSNAQLLSSDLATLISGRFIQIPVYPLSFSEYSSFNLDDKKTDGEKFEKYLRIGGLPSLLDFSGNEQSCSSLIRDIFDTIILKDVVTRHKIRNVGLLQNIVHYLVDNIGKLFSARKVVDYLKSQQIRLSVETVCDYIQYLCSTYALHQVKRYDIRGKRHLEISEKYYLNDLGIRHALLGYRNNDIDAFLENIVYLELLRRGYDVSIGKFDEKEIDFIAEKPDQKIYIQVTYLISTKEVFDREFSVLKLVPDNYPKFVLSLDPESFGGSFDGIQRLNLVSWLNKIS